MVTPRAGDAAGFQVELEGFSGPLDLLLEMARAQEVDLSRISVLALVDQYIAYLEAAKRLELRIAADYLVMAAWLLYLKSQLLLPAAERQEPEADELARALAERLRVLDGVRRAGAELLARPCLEAERLPRGRPEEPRVARRGEVRATLSELLAAWIRMQRRKGTPRASLAPRRWIAVETAISEIARRLSGREWRDLRHLLPGAWDDPEVRRSGVAAAFVAGLELARRGEVELHQPRPFSPIWIRRRG